MLKLSAPAKPNCATLRGSAYSLVRHCGVVVVANIVTKLLIPASLQRCSALDIRISLKLDVLQHAFDEKKWEV